uniref:Uncharacterized protein n=1 Tax=Avena sativa TaxID=4498 RepID=A0ACD5YPT3_AVESA
MANPSASGRATKQTCLCSPTNHPGSFRCSRHRTPGRRLPSSSLSSSARATQQAMASGMKSGGGGASRTASKGRSATLRAHLQRLLVSPPSSGSDHRRCRDFKPRMSRLGRLAAVNA